jgi:3-carboxy-cis,cis-muconate cycloisomerase
LTKLTEVFHGLHVDAPKMAAEIARSGRGAMTENLMLALTARGLDRADAHERLRTLTRDAGHGAGLAERAAADPTISGLLTPAEIRELLDPTAYVRAAAAKTDRVVDRVESELHR